MTTSIWTHLGRVHVPRGRAPSRHAERGRHSSKRHRPARRASCYHRSETPNRMRLGFGDFVVDFPARELRRAQSRVHVEPKALDFLELLIQSRPRVVPKAEILERLWPSTFVSESSLSRLAAELRAALGDDARSPRFIRTVHRRGYAFVGPVEEVASASRLPPAPLPCRLLFGERVLALQAGENLVGRGDEARSGSIRPRSRVSTRGSPSRDPRQRSRTSEARTAPSSVAGGSRAPPSFRMATSCASAPCCWCSGVIRRHARPRRSRSDAPE